MQQQEAPTQAAPDRLFTAFEHSITWEDDIWRADPVDVAEVHAKARRKFTDLLVGITSGRTAGSQDRILLFHGQSGAGKTHLIRALRTAAHRTGTAYFGYAQIDAGRRQLRRLLSAPARSTRWRSPTTPTAPARPRSPA